MSVVRVASLVLLAAGIQADSQLRGSEAASSAVAKSASTAQWDNEISAHDYGKRDRCSEGVGGNTLRCCQEYSSLPCPQLPAAVPVLEKPNPPPPEVQAAYGPVNLSTGETLEQALLKIPGIAQVTVLNPDSEGYSSAFLPANVEDDPKYANASYPTLWGDLGSLMQPGFGGLKTINVVNITPSSEGFDLFSMKKWNKAEKSQMCDIWWGASNTYENSIVQASEQVATCNGYTALTHCRLQKPITAIVGQGWHVGPGCFMERGCTEVDGTPKNWVARQLIANGWQQPPVDRLQIVLPACHFAEAENESACQACPFPEDPGEAAKITNLVEFHAAQKKAGKCVENLLQ